MENESLTDIIRDYFSDIEDLNYLVNPREKAKQIDEIAQEQGKNRASVASIFNRELKKIVKKNNMDMNEFFPQRQTKKYSNRLDIKVDTTPVIVNDDELPQTDNESSESRSDSMITTPKSNKLSETTTNDEDYSSIARVVNMLISMIFPDNEELTESEEKDLIASLKLLLGDKINDPKFKKICGGTGMLGVTIKNIMKKIKREKEEEKQKIVQKQILQTDT